MEPRTVGYTSAQLGSGRDRVGRTNFESLRKCQHDLSEPMCNRLDDAQLADQSVHFPRWD